MEYIINPIFINNCFCFQFHIKNAAFFDSSSLSIFLNSKNNIVTNLKLLISDNKSISFFTCRFSIMKLQLRIKRIQNLNIISFCIAFISIWSLGYFYIFFIQNFLPLFFVSLYKGLLEFLPAPLTWGTFSVCLIALDNLWEEFGCSIIVDFMSAMF